MKGVFMKKAGFILAIIAISSLLITIFIPIIGPVATGIVAVVALIISIVALHQVPEKKRYATKEIISITLSSLAIIFAVIILILHIAFGCKMMFYIQNDTEMNPFNQIQTHEKGTYNNLYDVYY
jgi:predicted PurR-regulated permease PerM